MTFSTTKPHVCPKCDGQKLQPPCSICNNTGVVWEPNCSELTFDVVKYMQDEVVHSIQDDIGREIYNFVVSAVKEAKIKNISEDKEEDEAVDEEEAIKLIRGLYTIMENPIVKDDKWQPLIDAFEKSKRMPKMFTITKDKLAELLYKMRDYRDWANVVDAFDYFDGMSQIPVPSRFVTNVKP